MVSAMLECSSVTVELAPSSRKTPPRCHTREEGEGRGQAQPRVKQPLACQAHQAMLTRVAEKQAE